MGHEAITGIVLGSGAIGSGYDFGYDRAPTFTSVAPDQATSGKAYTYAAGATDPDPDTLTFALLAGPSGMTVTAQERRASWTPATGDVGGHPIRLQVGDGRGGIAEQDYNLTVLPAGVEDPAHTTRPRRWSTPTSARPTSTSPRPSTPTATRSTSR